MLTRMVVLVLFWSFAEAQTVVSRADLMRLALRSTSVEVAQARVLSAELQNSSVGISGDATGSASVTGVVPNSGDSVLSYPWTLQFNLRFAGIWGEASEARVQASLNLERAKHGLVAAQMRSLGQALNLWHGLRRGLMNLRVAQMAFQLAGLEAEAAEVRLKSGAISLAERERLALALEFAQLEVARAETRLSGVRLQLEALFGLRNPVALDDWQMLPESLDSQFKSREDVFEAQAVVVLAKLQQDAAQRKFLPTLNLEASVRGNAGLLSLNANQFLALGVSYSYPVGVLVGVSTVFSVGISLSIPIQPLAFSGFEIALSSVSTAQKSLEITLALAKAEVVSKRLGLALVRSGFDFALRSSEFAERQFERVQVRVAVGLVSVLDLKRSELDVLKSKLQVFDAQADLDVAVFELSFALGLIMGVQ
jgi:outer membrane protein TolC